MSTQALQTDTLDRSSARAELERSTIAAVRKRLFILLFAMWFVSLIDRFNLGFAALRMNVDLGFNAEVYGFGAGIFFIGYIVAQIPSNLILQKLGARVWLPVLAVVWGVLAMAMAFIDGPTSFYIIRFLLGLAEAGFAPGVIFFMGLWMPKRHRAVSNVIFQAAIPISVVAVAPISGALLSLPPTFGLEGWQLMFLLEGAPAILLALVAFRLLTSRPREATWLRPDQRDWLVGQLALEESESAADGLSGFKDALLSLRVWLAAIAWFASAVAGVGILLWLPQILSEASGMTVFQVSLASSMPFAAEFVGLLGVGWLSQRLNEQHYCFIISAVVAAAGIWLSSLSNNPWLILFGVSLGGLGIGGTIAVFWPISMSFMSATAAATGIALINVIGSWAGFLGSYWAGAIRTQTNSFSLVFVMYSAFLVVSAASIFWLRQITVARVAR